MFSLSLFQMRKLRLREGKRIARSGPAELGCAPSSIWQQRLLGPSPEPATSQPLINSREVVGRHSSKDTVSVHIRPEEQPIINSELFPFITMAGTRMPGIPIPSPCAPRPPGAGHDGDRNWGRRPSWSLRREDVPGPPVPYTGLFSYMYILLLLAYTGLLNAV